MESGGGVFVLLVFTGEAKWLVQGPTDTHGQGWDLNLGLFDLQSWTFPPDSMTSF